MSRFFARSGVKYILRTDIMYQKETGESVDPNEQKALSLAQEAERLEVRDPRHGPVATLSCFPSGFIFEYNNQREELHMWI